MLIVTKTRLFINNCGMTVQKRMHALQRQQSRQLIFTESL